jgi:hypothetical protein
MSILDIILGGQGLPPDQFNDRFSGEPPRPLRDEAVDQDLREFWMRGADARPMAPEGRNVALTPPEDAGIPPGATLQTGPAPTGLPIVNPPLPRPRPMDAPSPVMTPDVMGAVDSFAPTDVQRMSRGMPPIPQDTSGLGGLVAGPSGRAAQTFLRSLSAGLAGMKNSPFKGQAFANAAGSAMQGGEKFEDTREDKATKRGDTNFNQRLAALKALIDMRKAGSQEEFDRARADYYRVYSGTRQQDSNTKAIRGLSDRPEQKTVIESERLIGTNARRIDEQIRRIQGDYNLKPEEKAAKVAELEKQRDGYATDLRGRLGVKPRSPAGRSAAAPPEISMEGQGTREVPYSPQTPEDYDEIEPGTYYIHPSDGKLRLKK